MPLQPVEISGRPPSTAGSPYSWGGGDKGGVTGESHKNLTTAFQTTALHEADNPMWDGVSPVASRLPMSVVVSHPYESTAILPRAAPIEFHEHRPYYDGNSTPAGGEGRLPEGRAPFHGDRFVEGRAPLTSGRTRKAASNLSQAGRVLFMTFLRSSTSQRKGKYTTTKGRSSWGAGRRIPRCGKIRKEDWLNMCICMMYTHPPTYAMGLLFAFRLLSNIGQWAVVWSICRALKQVVIWREKNSLKCKYQVRSNYGIPLGEVRQAQRLSVDKFAHT